MKSKNTVIATGEDTEHNNLSALEVIQQVGSLDIPLDVVEENIGGTHA